MTVADNPIYTPTPPTIAPQTDDSRNIADWMQRELRNISNALTNVSRLQLVPIARPPATPRDGLIAYADGVNWNPELAGAGPRVFKGGFWNNLALTFNGIVSITDPPYNADPSGVIDATTAIQSAYGSGAGAVYFPKGTYKISGTLAKPIGQYWLGSSMHNTILSWAGANSVDVILLNQDRDGGLENLTVDGGTATGLTGLHVVDSQSCRFTSLTFKRTGAGSASGTGLRLQAGNGGSGQTFNTAFNHFSQIKTLLFTVGLQLDGISTGPTVVTLNTFHQLDLEQNLTGIRLAQWCDSNDFYSIRIEVEQPNTFGVINNDSGTPGSDVGVYDNNFYGLQVDGFGAASNVAAWFSNVSKQNIVKGLFCSPTTFPGTPVVDNSNRSQGHYIIQQSIDSSTNSFYSVKKNVIDVINTTALSVVNGLNSNIVWNVNSGPRLRLTGPTGAFSIGGFIVNIDGLILRIYNSTAQQMTIVNEDLSSTAGNRIKTLTGANVVLRAGPSFATFSYDGTDARWTLESTN